MEFDPDWNEELTLKSSVNSIHENGDIMMLEESHRQDDAVLFIESIQQFTESELSRFNDVNIAREVKDLDHDFILESSNDSGFSPDKAFHSIFVQENTSYENTFHPHEDEFMDLLLENENPLVGNHTFFDCGPVIDYNDKLDYKETDEFQVGSILSEYITSADSFLDPINDPKIKCEAKVRLERLPESITKVKPTTDVTTDRRIELKKRKKFVQRYCHKCKKFDIDSERVSIPKNCQDCGNLLIYLCIKCKERYFVSYVNMMIHMKVCRLSKKGPADVPKSLVLYDCRNCDFRSLHKYSTIRHLRTKNHRLKDAGADLLMDVNEDPTYTKEFEKDYTKAFKRFCAKCSDIISSISSRDDKLCEICNTRLFYRCYQCGTISKHYKSLVYHLDKCLLKKYKCCKCNYETHRWKWMRTHMKGQHFSRVNVHCEHCNFETSLKRNLIKHLAFKHNKGESFCCKICNKYSTSVDDRLEKHILRRHPKKVKKNEQSETFECAICRRYRTNDNDDLWKHIERRHCEK